MNNVDLLSSEHWQPFAWLGFTHSFFNVEIEPVIYTWLVLFIMLLLFVPVRWLLTRKNSLVRFTLVSSIRAFMDFCTQTIGYFSYTHFCFIASLFIFILFCNSIALIPYCEEPTRNLNTTLALGIISFLYIQVYAIKTHGIGAYIKEYFDPIFIMAPLNVIGKLANIVSMSFRLFGNVFGGSIIAQIALTAIRGSLLWELIGIGAGLNLFVAFLGLFEGVLQAFVFASLSLTYLSLVIAQDEPQGENA